MTTYKFGLLAETVAALFLKAKFYQILAKRMRNFAGEIDLIARRGKTIIFVEVKARKILDESFEVLTSYQQTRIKKAAELYLSQHPKYANYDIRFDLIIITPLRLPMHIKNAW
jgi:putative endonuclease